VKYIKWQIHFESGSSEGTSPEETLKQRGSNVYSNFSITPHELVGFIDTDDSLVGLDKWNVQELTKDQVLEYAKAKNAEAFITSKGDVTFPDQVGV